MNGGEDKAADVLRAVVTAHTNLAETRAVGYCATRSWRETHMRMSHVIELLQRDGCVSVSALMRALHITYSQAHHLMRVAVATGRGVRLVLGNTAILCRDRAAAEELVRRLREVIHRLATESGMRYVTSTKILRMVLRDRDAYELMSRLIPLKRNMRRFPPAVCMFIGDILRTLYGEPVLRTSRRTVYLISEPLDFNIADDKGTVNIYTAATPRVDVGDTGGMPVVAFHIPRALLQALDEYARRLNAARSDVIRMAIQQMLERIRATVMMWTTDKKK